MTLIVGINLSDRIYFGADTRVTLADHYIDDIIKISNLSGLSSEANSIAMAVAGELNFATYVHNKIQQGLVVGIISSNIRVFVTQIEDFMKNIVNEWLSTNNYPNSAIIFGGMCTDGRKRIDLDRLCELQKIYKDSVPSAEELDRVKKQVLSEPIFQLLAQKVPMRNLMMPFDEPEKIELNKYLQEALEKKEDTLNTPDSLIFGIQVNRNGINIDIAEWGELLVFGSKGMTKENISESFLSSMELRPGRSVTQPHLMETGDIRQEIRRMAEKNKLDGVGGAIITAVIQDNTFNEVYQFQSTDEAGRLIEGVFLSDIDYVSLRDGKLDVLLNFFEYQKKDMRTDLYL